MRERLLGARGGGRRVRVLGAVTGAVLVLAAVAGYELVHLSGAGPARSEAISKQVSPLVSSGGLQARSGVRISQLALTGAGGLIDLRFQVVDPNRAASVHSPATPPMLVDERTGVVVNELFMGHQHRSGMKAGQSYYLIFVNPGNLVERGSRVTVQLGAARVAHVAVQ
jgi:hypothetical protein